MICITRNLTPGNCFMHTRCIISCVVSINIWLVTRRGNIPWKDPGEISLNYDFSFLGKFDDRSFHDVKSKLHEFVIVHVSR